VTSGAPTGALCTIWIVPGLVSKNCTLPPLSSATSAIGARLAAPGSRCPAHAVIIASPAIAAP
jgi:hypothetical protein